MGKSVEMLGIEHCDFSHERPVLALYDGKTKEGPWAYMCEAHWLSEGVGQLGTGFGQALIYPPSD
jgi:hypothetical protein